MKIILTVDTRLGGEDDVITWGLEEPASHFAIVFFDCIVFHAHFWGVGFDGINEVLEHRRIVDIIDIPLSLDEEIEVVRNIKTKKHDNKSYDYLFFLWLAWRVVLLKLFDKKVPDEVGLQSKTGLLCNEAFSILPDRIKNKYKIDPKKAVTPYKTMQLLRKTIDGKQD